MRATLSPLSRGEGSDFLLPACGEKVPKGRMRGEAALEIKRET
jgi:hypothetical protein